MLSLPETAGELALDVLRRHASAFAEHAPHARLGTDPVHVHQARVATRRLRSALRVFEDVLPTELDGLRDELGWIGTQLGGVRDLDVQARRLHNQSGELGLADALVPYATWLEEQRQRALAAFEDAFASPRFGQLTDRLCQMEQLAPVPERDAPLRDDAPQRLRRAHRQLRKRAERVGVDSPAIDFHKVRIRAKRLRYTAEFFEALYGKPGQRVIKSATEVQDVLGDHQDGIVNTQHIHAAIETAAPAWPAETSVALGQLIQWEAQHGRELRKQFKPVYRELESAWRRLRHAL